MTKLEAFHWCFVTKLNTPKTSPFCGKLKIFSDFLFHFRASGTFLKSLIHFGVKWDIYISKNLQESLPALLKIILTFFLENGYLNIVRHGRILIPRMTDRAKASKINKHNEP